MVLKQNQLCHINDFMSHYQPKESTYLKGISFAVLPANISLTTFMKVIFLRKSAVCEVNTVQCNAE